MNCRWMACVTVMAVLVFAGTALAQYTGPGGMSGTTTPGSPNYTKRSYGVNKAAMAGAIGAGIVGGVLLLKHHHHTMTACVGEDGTTLDDGKDIYTLVSGPMKPGERIVASGKKVKSDAGTPGFEVNSVRKDLGRCGAQTTTESAKK